MPTMANVTVKAADGSTDVVYYARNPSGGDGQKALWKALAVGSQDNQHPWLTVQSAASSDGRSRKVRVAFSYPQSATNSTTGLISVVNQTPFEVVFTRPLGVPDAIAGEAAAQFPNLMASALLKAVFLEGFAPQ